MTSLLALALRVVVVLTLLVVVLVAARALVWVVRPWFQAEGSTKRRLLVDPFDVVKEGEVQKLLGEAFARQLTARMRQIDIVLTAQIAREGAPPGAIVEGVVPRQVNRAPAVDTRLDFGDVKPFGVDVVGILNTLRRQLQTDDRIHGTVTVGADRVDVFAEMASGRTDASEPWDLRVPGNMAAAVDALSHAVVRRLLENSYLSSLNDAQFVTFVDALRAYQRYVRAPGPGTEPDLQHSQQQFESLRNQGGRAPHVYSYLASIHTLQNPRDIDTPISLLQEAARLDPSSSSIRERLGELEKTRPTVAPQKVERSPGSDLLNQPSLERVRAQQAIAAAGQGRTVTIGVLTNGVNTALPALKEHVVAAESIIPGEAATEDRLDYGTHVVSYLAAIAPRARIVVIKALNEQGSADINSLYRSAVPLAVRQKVDVLIAPLGSTDDNAIGRKMLADAESRGILVVAAAGNAGDSAPQYPAAFPGVLAVGSTDTMDRRAEYSSYGEHVPLFAPGDAVAFGQDGKPAKRLGTTFAATLAGGIAALVLQTGFKGTPADVRKLLIDSAVSVGSLRRVDALAAVEAAAAAAGR